MSHVCGNRSRRLPAEGNIRRSKAANVKQNVRFTHARISGDPELVKFYTGLPQDIFEFLICCMKQFHMIYLYT